MAMKYKIAYLMHGYRNVGGGEYSIYYLIKNLKRDVFVPIVFFTHENEVVQRMKEDGVPLVHVPLGETITSVYRDSIGRNPTSFLKYIWFLSAGISRTSALLKEHRIDLLHSHDNLSKIIGGPAAWRARIPVICHCRDLLKESVIEKLLIYYQLLFMDRILAVSEGNCRLFRVFGRIPGKVRIIYNGIDLSKFDIEKTGGLVRSDFGIGKGEFVVGIIGMFDRIKGHTYLFRALHRMAANGRNDFICLVVGEGRERDEIRRDVYEKELHDRVKFLGYRNDIPDLLRLMDVVVMPSLQESFPRVPLEAMAMKVPVIASTVGGLPESVIHGETGILVPPGDSVSLHDALMYLYRNPDVRKKMGEAGRKRVEGNFNIESNIRATEALYLEILRPGADFRRA
jgi:glycosyltransferase involved in cell wall biosynthesis